VDSRNVRGMAGHVSGVKRLPGVAGVIAALSGYGFEVTAVAVGIAQPEPGVRASAQMQAAARENSASGSPLERTKQAFSTRCCGLAVSCDQDLVATPVKWRPLSPVSGRPFPACP